MIVLNFAAQFVIRPEIINLQLDIRPRQVFHRDSAAMRMPLGGITQRRCDLLCPVFFHCIRNSLALRGRLLPILEFVFWQPLSNKRNTMFNSLFNMKEQRSIEFLGQISEFSSTLVGTFTFIDHFRYFLKFCQISIARKKFPIAVPVLWIDWPQHRVIVHIYLISGESQNGSS